jgi:hypothetical protein
MACRMRTKGHRRLMDHLQIWALTIDCRNLQPARCISLPECRQVSWEMDWTVHPEMPIRSKRVGVCAEAAILC